MGPWDARRPGTQLAAASDRSESCPRHHSILVCPLSKNFFYFNFFGENVKERQENLIGHVWDQIIVLNFGATVAKGCFKHP